VRRHRLGDGGASSGVREEVTFPRRVLRPARYQHFSGTFRPETTMTPFDPFLSRRGFLSGSLALGATAITPWFTCRGAFAAELMKTPSVTEGPFYPDKLPLDTDNDLLIINDKITPAVGDITHLMGTIKDTDGAPMKGLTIEIWQVDNGGAYLHSGTGNKDKQDKNFQGFGRFTTHKSGAYYFRTIKPVPYPGRTPHIHYKVKRGGKELLVTQLYVADEKERNMKDGVYVGVKDAKQRAAITADFTKMKGSKLGELTASFDIVLGVTPEVD
jgi:protocatechuate 3,4-dioxygenase beta subunit